MWESHGPPNFIRAENDVFYYTSGSEPEARKPDGTALWTLSTPEGNYSPESFGRDEECVYVGYRLGVPEKYDGGGIVRAYDAETGEQRWSYESDDEHTSVKAVTRVGSHLIVGLDENGLATNENLPRVVALDPETGDERWRTSDFYDNNGMRPVGTYITDIVGYEGIPYVGIETDTVILEPETGEVDDVLDLRGHFSIVDGYLYGVFAGDLKRYDPKSGEVEDYHTIVDDPMRDVVQHHTIVDDLEDYVVGETVVAFGTREGGVNVLDTDSGEERWEQSTTARPVGITVTDDEVWVVDRDGFLYGYAKDDGELRFESERASYGNSGEIGAIASVGDVLCVALGAMITGHRLE
jgi:outer membrane protein assembly factor BamB